MSREHDREFKYPACIRAFTQRSVSGRRGSSAFVDEQYTVPYYSISSWILGGVRYNSRRWVTGRCEVPADSVPRWLDLHYSQRLCMWGRTILTR